jgi:hypothetical protein
MEGFWEIFFLAVVLKVPVIGAMVLIWWAIKAGPVTEDAPPSEDHGFRRWRRTPRRPRGPHGAPGGGVALIPARHARAGDVAERRYPAEGRRGARRNRRPARTTH